MGVMLVEGAFTIESIEVATKAHANHAPGHCFDHFNDIWPRRQCNRNKARAEDVEVTTGDSQDIRDNQNKPRLEAIRFCVQ